MRVSRRVLKLELPDARFDDELLELEPWVLDYSEALKTQETPEARVWATCSAGKSFEQVLSVSASLSLSPSLSIYLLSIHLFVYLSFFLSRGIGTLAESFYLASMWDHVHVVR